MSSEFELFNISYDLGFEGRNTVPMPFISDESKVLLDTFLKTLFLTELEPHILKVFENGYNEEDITIEMNTVMYVMSSKKLEFLSTTQIKTQHFIHALNFNTVREVPFLSAGYSKTLNEIGAEFQISMMDDLENYRRHLAKQENDNRANGSQGKNKNKRSIFGK